MRIRDVVVWHSAIWLMAGSSVCAISEENPAAKPVTGKPGVVLSRTVVNFSEAAQREALHPTPRTQKPQPPEREAPRKQGLPAGAIIKLAPTSGGANPSATGVNNPSPLSLVLANNFPAEPDNHTVIPPDTQGTAGPNHLMVTLNSNVVVQDRVGNRLKVVSLDNFWQPTGNSQTTDPRVVYDPFNDRWIMATSGDFLLTTAGVLVGVSQTGDPTGNWNLYKVAVDGVNTHFCDFPVLGFNKTWVVIMCNVFDRVNTQFFKGYVYVFDKFNLYNHGDGSHVVLETVNGDPTLGDDSNVTPASTYDNSVATEYLVEEYNGNQGGMGLMRLWAINGPVGSPTLSTIAFPGTSTPWDENGTRNFAPQLGSSTGIDTGDARIGNVIYRNGTLWTAHPVYYPCCASSHPPNPPNRSSIQWWQIDTSGNVLQHGLIDTLDASFFRSYPTIAVNQFNDALIGYSRFSPNEFAGGFYSFHAHSDPAGVLEAETTLKAGEATYVKTGSGSSNRWGDYSNTAVDPADDMSFWTIQEYAASPSSNWGTWWGNFVQPPTAIQVTPSGTTLTAGVPLADLAVTVVDSQGDRVTGYTGTVHFTSSDPRFSMPDYTFSASDQGAHDFHNVITLFTAGPRSITLNDFANSVQGTQNFTVQPGPTSVFTLIAPATTQAGLAFNLSVIANDAYQNLTPAYNGTVHFASSDSMANLPANYMFNPGPDNGQHTFNNVVLKTAGTQTVITQDLTSFAIQGGTIINVTPAAPHHLVLGAPATVTRTQPFTVSVTAQDQFNNVATSYNGTIQFTSSDGAASLPGSYMFDPANDHGRHYFLNVALNTIGIGTQTVTATDMVTSSITGSASINVARLSGTARTLYVRLGQQFTNLLVANFSEDVSPDPSTLSASIDWGDGSTATMGTVTGSSGVYSVSGSHRYTKLPEHPAMITIHDDPNGFTPITLVDTVRIWPKTESH